jgi:NAD(P)-dependent dehydrogenase (short-subunit alcohol dehydrogenase family)
MKVLIFGASKGIGQFLFIEFKNRGYNVYGTYNSTISKVGLLKDSLIKVDISKPEEIKGFIGNVSSSTDNLTIINCIGINYNSFAHKADVDLWKNVIDINLIGTFRVINAVLPIMRESGFGRIINISSVVAQRGVPGTSAYAASKAALWGMAKCIAVENAAKGITINNLNLGYFNIGMTTEISNDILDGIKKSIPSGKLGNPDNILKAVMFLINSEYTTGSSFDINGGLI